MATINNSKSNKVLNGTSGDDTINNFASSVTITGGKGNDYVYNRGGVKVSYAISKKWCS